MKPPTERNQEAVLVYGICLPAAVVLLVVMVATR